MSLIEVLREVKERSDLQSIDKSHRIEFRSKEIKNLLDTIQKWLKPSIADGIVNIKRYHYTHTDTLGILVEECLSIIIGGDYEILISPCLNINRARVCLVITYEQLSTPIYFMDDGLWYFQNPTSPIQVTEETFTEAIQELFW